MAAIVEEDGLRVDYVTIPNTAAYKRDAGKVFRIKEWGARRAETWAWGMVFALKGTSGSIPDDVARLGMVGVGIRLINTVLGADVRYADIKPFMDELIDECVTIVRDPTNRDKSTNLPIATAHNASDFIEVGTLQWLRSEVLRVHTNFSVIDALSALAALTRSGLQASSITPTSPQ